jgi:phage shock protein E
MHQNNRERNMGTMKRLARGVVFLQLLMLITLAGCGEQSRGAQTSSPQAGKLVETEQGSYINLTPAELKPMLANKDLFLVDTHVPPEGRLPGTVARIPFDQVEAQLDKFPTDKSAPIVLACMSGRMSSEASRILVRLGYTNVYNLDGGMIAWREAGYEIIPEGR